MIILRKELALVGILAATSLAAATGLRSRQAEPSNFKLYAYGGETIGGFPVFYADGLAYAGNSSAFTTGDEVTDVTLTASADGVWTAIPQSNVTWSSKIFYVSNTTSEIGFIDAGNSSSNIITSAFRFYGQSAMLRVSNKMEASWTARATGVEHVWSLGWASVTEDPSLTGISLRNVAPQKFPATGDDG